MGRRGRGGDGARRTGRGLGRGREGGGCHDTPRHLVRYMNGLVGGETNVVYEWIGGGGVKQLCG